MTRARCWVAVAAVVLQAACGTSRNHTQPAPRLSQTTEVQSVDSLLLATASAIVKSSGSLTSIWTGYWPQGQGFIIARPRGDILLVSRVAPDSGFQRLNGRLVPRVLRGRAFARRGVVAGLFASRMDGGLNIHYAVAGTSVTAVAVKDSVRTTAEFLFHEAFHAFQDSHFAKKPEAGAERSPNDAKSPPEFSAMAEVERRILAEALSADDTDTRALLRCFVAVRSRRFSSISEAARTEELQMERIEGSAQLVGVQASLAVVRADSKQAEPLLRELLTSHLAESDAYWRIRLRVYGTGAATGLLLDRVGVPWRSELAGGATFFDIVKAAFALPAGTEDALAESTLARFGYSHLLEQENAALHRGPELR